MSIHTVNSWVIPDGAGGLSFTFDFVENDGNTSSTTAWLPGSALQKILPYSTAKIEALESALAAANKAITAAEEALEASHKATEELQGRINELEIRASMPRISHEKLAEESVW